jgi:hypothetical protein
MMMMTTTEFLVSGIAVDRRAVPKAGYRLHNSCITTHGHSETLTGTQEVRAVQLKRLTSTFLPPLQGGGRRFDPYSAHTRSRGFR